MYICLCVYVHTNMSFKTLHLHPHNSETQKWGGPEFENLNLKPWIQILNP